MTDKQNEISAFLSLASFLPLQVNFHKKWGMETGSIILFLRLQRKEKYTILRNTLVLIKQGMPQYTKGKRNIPYDSLRNIL